MKGILQKACRMALFAVVSVSGPMALSVHAEEYKSMIRYDRVWECHELENGQELFKYMRFDGPEEINGKSYHRIITFMKAKLKYSSASDEYYYGEIEDGLYLQEGYLREENGVVYAPMLVAPGTKIDLSSDNIDETTFEYEIFSTLYLPEYSEYVDSMEIIDLPIFDFNRSIGDVFYCIDHCADLGAGVFPFRIDAIDLIDIGEETCRKISFNPYNSKESVKHHYETVEGVGLVKGGGSLNYQCLVNIPTGMFCHNDFNRLFDLEGNKLYESEDAICTYLPYPDTAFQPMMETKSDDPSDFYDMLGRRIVTPSPGQLYIQGGRKRIGK